MAPSKQKDKGGQKRKRHDPRRRSFFQYSEDETPSSAQKRQAAKAKRKRRKSTSRPAQLNIETEDGFLYKVVKNKKQQVEDEEDEDDGDAADTQTPSPKAAKRSRRGAAKKQDKTEKNTKTKPSKKKTHKKITKKIPSHPTLTLEPSAWEGGEGPPSLVQFFQHTLEKEYSAVEETYTGDLAFIASAIKAVGSKFTRYAEKKIPQIINNRTVVEKKPNMRNIDLRQQHSVLTSVLEKCQTELTQIELESTSKTLTAAGAAESEGDAAMITEGESLEFMNSNSTGLLSKQLQELYPGISIKSDVVLKALRDISKQVQESKETVTKVAGSCNISHMVKFGLNAPDATKSAIQNMLL